MNIFKAKLMQFRIEIKMYCKHNEKKSSMFSSEQSYTYLLIIEILIVLLTKSVSSSDL